MAIQIETLRQRLVVSFESAYSKIFSDYLVQKINHYWQSPETLEGLKKVMVDGESFLLNRFTVTKFENERENEIIFCISQTPAQIINSDKNGDIEVKRSLNVYYVDGILKKLLFALFDKADDEEISDFLTLDQMNLQELQGLGTFTHAFASVFK